jgi:hypothetical protein
MFEALSDTFVAYLSRPASAPFDSTAECAEWASQHLLQCFPSGVPDELQEPLRAMDGVSGHDGPALTAAMADLSVAVREFSRRGRGG